MKIVVRMSNEGGELDRRELDVTDPENEADGQTIAAAMIEMITETSNLRLGDTFTVEEG